MYSKLLRPGDALSDDLSGRFVDAVKHAHDRRGLVRLFTVVDDALGTPVWSVDEFGPEDVPAAVLEQVDRGFFLLEPKRLPIKCSLGALVATLSLSRLLPNRAKFYLRLRARLEDEDSSRVEALLAGLE